MKFQETYDFDHGSDIILRMFTDRDFYLRKYERMGGAEPDIVDCVEDTEQFSITVRHALDASKMKLPDLIKSRIGDHLMLRQTDRWQASIRHGRIDIAIEKAPATVSIDMRLADVDGQARLTLDFNVSVSIPLVGGRVEKAIAEPMTRHLRKDLQISNRIAADYADALDE